MKDRKTKPKATPKRTPVSPPGPAEAQGALFPPLDAGAAPSPDRRRAAVFAFGSNADIDQMRRRCPSVRLLGTATLPGHAMAFAGHSVTRGGPVATVFACDALAVPGALYSITRDDLAALDRFEGVPRLYERTTAWVNDAKARRRRAEVYRLLPEHFTLGIPAPAYLGQIVTAYRRLGIPRQMLSIALSLGERVNGPQRAKRPLTSKTADPTYASRPDGSARKRTRE